ncbi:hypothetical protein [Nonomuraea sp. NPDC049480]|uniref:hypothetical protein n=1 Tax=Nonomuraea sp. NPDC049480 TaxID=3364353 RepID=UPI00378D5952
MNRVLDEYFPALEKSVGTVRACEVFGRSRATLHRHRRPRPPVHGPRRPFHHPAELSQHEREQVLAVLDSPRFADKSPGQVWAVLLDEGVYLCSQATMYRLLRERGQNGERRAQAVRPSDQPARTGGRRPQPGVVVGHRAPRGAMQPSGGGRPPPPGRRSDSVKLGAA